ncbi:HAMP domain-containing protein [Streptomyces sp. NPDC047002]|uniref:cache domain-containing protein n=1 Tax=Streptomyces sp. NPDC047002 TaxID=3155475 RepID=UPI0034523EC0
MPLLGGVRPPLAALLCLLLAVAAVTLVGIGRAGHGDASRPAGEAERAVARDAAADLHASVTAHADALRESASAFTATAAEGTAPAAALKSLVPPDTSGRGAALLDSGSGRLLAGSGESLPLSAVHAAQARPGGRALAPTLVPDAGAGPRLLYFARVTVPGSGPRIRWLLAVSETVQVPKVHGDGRSVRLLLPGGRPLASSGSADLPQAAPSPAPSPSSTGIQRRVPLPADTAAPLPATDAGLTARAAAAAAAPGAADAGSLLGADSDGRRTVAGWAAVGTDADARDLPMTVFTYRTARSGAAAAAHSVFAAEAAGALVVLALLVWLVLWLTVQRPLLRLHLSATRLASATAAGRRDPRGELGRPVPVPRFGEPARIGRALESLRRQAQHGEAPPAPLPGGTGRGPGLRALVVVCAAVLAAWSLPLLFLLNQVDAASAVPEDQVLTQQSRTQSAADRTRASLEQATLELGSVAPRVGAGSTAQRRAALRSFLRHHGRFRSVYLVDGAGRAHEHEGAAPLRTVHSAPSGTGILSVSSTGRVPAVAAHVPVTVVSGGKQTPTTEQVYGEIDESRLADRLKRPGLGDTYLVDGAHRVLAASVGFTAYQQLPGQGLTALTADTAAGDAKHRHPESGVVGGGRRGLAAHAAVAAAVPLAATGPTQALDWQVVAAEPAQALPLAAYETQWFTMLAGLLGLTVSLACLGWLHVVVVRPTRSLAVLAVNLAEGDRRTVLYPVHHDEVGSVTRGFELLRQALTREGRRPAAGSTAPAAPRPPADPFASVGHGVPTRVTWGTPAQYGEAGAPGSAHHPAPRI